LKFCPKEFTENKTVSIKVKVSDGKKASVWQAKRKPV
jgi:hypothetical protein